MTHLYESPTLRRATKQAIVALVSATLDRVDLAARAAAALGVCSQCFYRHLTTALSLVLAIYVAHALNDDETSEEYLAIFGADIERERAALRAEATRQPTPQGRSIH